MPTSSNLKLQLVTVNELTDLRFGYKRVYIHALRAISSNSAGYFFNSQLHASLRGVHKSHGLWRLC